MKVNLWPSGHSDDYSLILVFRSEGDAVKKRKDVKTLLHELGKSCNGSLIVPYRLQNALFIDYELNQDSDSRHANAAIQASLHKTGARITKIFSPRKNLEKQVWLSFTLPKAEELVIMSPEQMKLLQSVIWQARRSRQSTALGSRTKIHCALPDGEKKTIWLYVGWEGTPIELLKSTLKDVRLVTPAGEFSLN